MNVMVFELGDDERFEKKERRRRNAPLADILILTLLRLNGCGSE